MSDPPDYFDYVSGEPNKFTPKRLDVVELDDVPIPEITLSGGIVVEEERFDTLSGLHRRVAEKMADER